MVAYPSAKRGYDLRDIDLGSDAVDFCAVTLSRKSN
jgi:hypothetical protein